MPVTLRSSSASVHSSDGGQVQVGEEDLALAHPVVLLGDRLLDLEDQVAGRPDVVGGRRGSSRRRPTYSSSGIDEPDAGVLLDEDLVAVADELVHAGRGDRHPVLVVLDLAGDADLHGYQSFVGSAPTSLSARRESSRVAGGKARPDEALRRSPRPRAAPAVRRPLGGDRRLLGGSAGPGHARQGRRPGRAGPGGRAVGPCAGRQAAGHRRQPPGHPAGRRHHRLAVPGPGRHQQGSGSLGAGLPGQRGAAGTAGGDHGRRGPDHRAARPLAAAPARLGGRGLGGIPPRCAGTPAAAELLAVRALARQPLRRLARLGAARRGRLEGR